MPVTDVLDKQISIQRKHKLKEKLERIKKESYIHKEIDSGLDEKNWEMANGKDDTHEVMKNLTWVRNQLGKEILESFLEYDERNLGTNNKEYGNELENEFDTNPDLSIKYNNDAYVVEEQIYYENFIGEPKSTGEINKNRSIGDLILEWIKCGNFMVDTEDYGVDLDKDFKFSDIGFDINAAIKHLVDNYSKVKSGGRCAYAVRKALEAGGLSTDGRPVEAKNYVKFLPKIGFKHIRTIHHDNNYSKYMTGLVVPGDIAVMQNPNGGAGHICMYCGNKRWNSDFKQQRAWVYGGDCGVLYIFRFAGVDKAIEAGNIKVPTAGEPGIKNGIYCVKWLCKKFNLQPINVIGFAGCWMQESNCDPTKYNKSEKAGKFKGSSANGRGYGAGIAQWSNQRKFNLMATMKTSQPIETWPLEMQLNAAASEMRSSFIDKLRVCTTIEESTDIVLRGYENGGGGAGPLASKSQIDKYTWDGGYRGAMAKRVGYAKQVWAAMTHRNINKPS